MFLLDTNEIKQRTNGDFDEVFSLGLFPEKKTLCVSLIISEEIKTVSQICQLIVCFLKFYQGITWKCHIIEVANVSFDSSAKKEAIL